MSTTMFFGLLGDGITSAAILLLIAFVLRRYTRLLLALLLMVAALVYIYFAQGANAGPAWLVVELVGVAIFGAMGLVGVVRSPWWLVAGWALHPLWDIALHFVGPGHTFAPITYTIPCLSFDLLVAGIIAIAIVRGWPQFASRIATPRVSVGGD